LQFVAAPCSVLQWPRDALANQARRENTALLGEGFVFRSGKEQWEARNSRAPIDALFDFFGMAWHNSVANWAAGSDAEQFPLWAHGSIPHRRRDTAILSIASANWRLNASGRSHLFCVCDGTNAFACSAKRDLQLASAALVRRRRQCFLKDRLEAG